jgi:hypothetical protein
MKTTKRLLIILAVLALPLWIAGSAAGGVDCGKYPDGGHPLCPPPDDPTPTTEPDTTTTTAPSDALFGLTCAEYDLAHGLAEIPLDNRDMTDQYSFDVTVAAGLGVCIDVYGAAAGTWDLAAEWEGSVRGVFQSLRDSVPGDFCHDCNGWRVKDLKGLSDLSWTVTPMDATTAEPAGSFLNACGSQFKDGSQIELVDGDWQVVVNPDGTYSGTTDATGEAHPLALVLGYSGSAPSMTFHVEIPRP